MASVLKTDRVGIYLRFEAPLTETEISTLRQLIVRKSKGEPTAYLIGEKYFCGHRFAVGPGVLIPRPETELIVEDVLIELKTKNCLEAINIADFGAGSGCLGISLGLEWPQSLVTLIEKSPQTFSFCQQNVENLVDTANRGRFKLVQGAVEDYPGEKCFQLIVANPPYIDFDDPEVSPTVKQFEPHEALFADGQGLASVISWLEKSKQCLIPGGLCYFEIGYKQGPEVQALFEKSGAFRSVEILRDFSKRDRIIKAVKNG